MGSIKAKDGDGNSKYFNVVNDGTSASPFMSVPADFYLEIQKGNVEGHSIVNKFGRNSTVGTSFVPVTIGGTYVRRQPAGAETLRIKAGGNANDTAAGTGARQITIQGLDETGAIATETITTAGASASSSTTTTFTRLFRAWVSQSGSYSGGSHAGDIVIEDSSGTEDWLTIDSTLTAEGQSEVAVYCVPTGYTAYVRVLSLTIESSKDVDLRFFKRGGALNTAAPYEARRSVFSWSSLDTSPTPIQDFIFGSFEENTDIGFIAKVSTGTASVAANFEIILVEN